MTQPTSLSCNFFQKEIGGSCQTNWLKTIAIVLLVIAIAMVIVFLSIPELGATIASFTGIASFTNDTGAIIAGVIGIGIVIYLVVSVRG